MALNPQFASQGTRKLPLAFGYVLGSGVNDLNATAQDGAQYARFILGEGEWDGIEMGNSYPLGPNGNNVLPAAGAHLWSNPVINSDELNLDPINPAAARSSLASFVHFHSGAYTPIGLVPPTPDPVTGVIPSNSSQSVGPDQGYDAWFNNFPTVMPPQALSGIAYSIWGAPSPADAYQMWLAWPPPGGPQSYGSYLSSIYQKPTISGIAVYRALRCRIFDALGNVIAYQFTCNPAWHKVEAILRRKIRPEKPGLAGLTDAEKACFNWDSIVTLAARNDKIGPTGAPQYVGNYIFAADTTLAQMMETMCRIDRSYQRIDDGKIVLQGDDPRASVFIASRNHLAGDSLNLTKKDVSKEPNVFVPTYRDLDIPAIAKVISAVSYGAFYLRGRRIIGFRAFTATTPSPFAYGSYFRYGGCSDPSWDGCYATFVPDESNDPYPKRSAHPNVTYALMSTPAGTPAVNVTGGYIGADDARFSQRAPTGVQHRSAQKIRAVQAPGLGVQPSVRKVFYDCGNSTFDQTNRLMKFERDRQLGTDTGDGWQAPIAGTLTLYLPSVDKNGAQLIEVAKQREVITLDEWLFPEKPGDYEILDVQIRQPRADDNGDVGEITLTVQQYNRSAYPLTSDSADDYFFPVPNSSLKLGSFKPIPNAAWVLQSTLNISGSGSTRDITIPDLVMQIAGKLTTTAYPAFSVTGVPISEQVVLWVKDLGGNAANPTYGWTLASAYDASSPNPTGGSGTAPTLTNLIQNADFSQSFPSGAIGSSFSLTDWDTLPGFPTGLFTDFVAGSTANGGEAVYTHTGGSAVTGTSPGIILSQTIASTSWSPGDYLMLSARIEDTAVSTANSGSAQAVLSFLDSTGTLISSVTASVALSGTAPSLTLIYTPSTQVPANTAQVTVSFRLGGSSWTFQSGSRLIIAQPLLELSTATQTTPSTYVVAGTGDGTMQVYTGTFV